MALSGDGVFSHNCVGTRDLAASTKFYDAALGALGVKNLGTVGDRAVMFGKQRPAFVVMRPRDGGEPSSNGTTVGFAASSMAEVDAFHAAGLAAGGSCEGEPGPRTLPNSYAAYLRDPSGNKICAYHFTA